MMERALVLARRAGGAGEVPVGAVVVGADGLILAEAGNTCVRDSDPSGHAEMVAVRLAGQRLGNYRLPGTTLFVTLEPCAMCAAALIHARVAGLVYGAADALAGAVVSRAEYFDAQCANHRVWHMGGVLAEECAALLHEFFAQRRD